jgi:hypothetical protein
MDDSREEEMDEYFAETKLTNTTALCVGGITSKEAQAARNDGLDVDGFGYYVFLAEENGNRHTIQILGKLFSAGHAERLARMLERRSS